MNDPRASEERPSRLARLLLFAACLGCGFATLILAQRSASHEQDAENQALREQIEDIRRGPGDGD
ncbi:hypothetical protein VT03_03640 [Planctomyces sp. SH-PL14]|nr:hypothetical protein VT03_03640 [Planctomyces sp. SH-PL14]